MGTMASQITSLTSVYSTVYSGADQLKHQSSASLAFVRGIYRWSVNSTHKGPATRNMFPLDDVIMIIQNLIAWRWLDSLSIKKKYYFDHLYFDMPGCREISFDMIGYTYYFFISYNIYAIICICVAVWTSFFYCDMITITMHLPIIIKRLSWNETVRVCWHVLLVLTRNYHLVVITSQFGGSLHGVCFNNPMFTMNSGRNRTIDRLLQISLIYLSGLRYRDWHS